MHPKQTKKVKYIIVFVKTPFVLHQKEVEITNISEVLKKAANHQ